MIWIFMGIAAVVFACDVLIKQGIEESFALGEEREGPGNRIVYRKVYNKGAALGLLKDHPRLLHGLSLGISGMILLGDVLLLRKKGRLAEKLGMMLLTGGTLSNLFDRLVRGKVIDYIGFRTRWKKLTSITYNLGDFAIFGGALLTILAGKSR